MGGPGSGRYPLGSGEHHDNSLDTIKSFSINNSDLISKDTEKVRKERYHNEVLPRLQDEPSQAGGKWHLAKRLLHAAQDKWQEKEIKDIYKQVTGQTWKPYVDDSDIESHYTTGPTGGPQIRL